MSGFAGIVSLDGAPPDALLLQRMAERLAFRGPDGTHITTKPGAGLCFAFLRTGPAPQCASQPCSIDGRVWLLGDVRLDGRGDLRRKLVQHGDQFEGEVTDEELILRAWRRWGKDGLQDLMGDFSFALWDGETRQLWCARDLMGARPFFYAQAGSRLYFSNTLNTIRCAPDISSALDEHFIGDFLLQGWCSDLGRSAFRDISRLRAGYALHYSTAGLQTRRFTSLPIEEPLWLKHEEEYVEQFRELFEQAVLDRLPRGPTAIFMSGGLDSTSVAAVAVQCARKRGLPLHLRAFTVDYQPLFDDREGVLASLAAQHIGIPIEIQTGASSLPYAGWDNFFPPMPEPYHEPFHALSVEQHRQVSQHARVALTGQGGDGILTGQSWPYLVYLVRGLQLKKLAGTFGGYIFRHGSFPPLRGGFRAKLRPWMKLANLRAEYPKWLAPHFETELNLQGRWQELQNPKWKMHPWYPRAYAMLTSESLGNLMEGEDSAWSGTPAESRAPLLDLRILRFLLRVPPVPLCINKELLRRAVRSLLPEQILSRRKTPFQGDSIALLTKTRRWSPRLIPEPLRILREFVDWETLRAILETTSISYPWSNLRPVSLSYWLHVIENQPSIQ
jgi:asparagine synthase (glutamine-hydrolysing)